MAAIETALIAPVAVGLLGLLAIWAEAIAIQRKVTLAARTITDLVSQQGTLVSGQTGSVNQSAVDNLLNNAANILYPYVQAEFGHESGDRDQRVEHDDGRLRDQRRFGRDTATVQWSEPMPSHGTALPSTAHAVTLPSSVAAAGSNVIMGTVTYTYTPPVIGEAAGTITLHQTIYLTPRQWTNLNLKTGKLTSPELCAQRAVLRRMI